MPDLHESVAEHYAGADAGDRSAGWIVRDPDPAHDRVEQQRRQDPAAYDELPGGERLQHALYERGRDNGVLESFRWDSTLELGLSQRAEGARFNDALEAHLDRYAAARSAAEGRGLLEGARKRAQKGARS